jgi:hypothetical protein
MQQSTSVTSDIHSVPRFFRLVSFLCICAFLYQQQSASAAIFAPTEEELDAAIERSPQSVPDVRALPHIKMGGKTYVQMGDMFLLTKKHDGVEGAFGGPRWTNGTVYYFFDAGVSTANRQTWRDAAATWSSVAALTFVELASGTGNYIYVQNDPDGDYSASIGMGGGKQTIGIHSWNCRFKVAHEIGHALGLIHEHNRLDRDPYITIITGNINSDGQGQFTQMSATTYGAYDFDSVMHYPRCAFSICGGSYPTCDGFSNNCAQSCWTISVDPPYNAQWQYLIGQRNHLSQFDKSGMSQRYGGGGPIITSVSPAFIGISQGGTFTITYTINASSPRTVILGASLFPAGQTTGRIDDPPHDQIVALSTGQNIVQRQFSVAVATPVGIYDLVVALWSDVNGNGIIDPSVDQEITEKTNANAVSVMNGGGCTYSLYPVELNLTSPGGATSSFNIATGSSCHWAAIPNQDWISINGAGSGNGSATVNFNVSTNSSASARTGTITVQTQTFTITQSGSSPPGGGHQNVTVSNVLVAPPSSRPGLTPTFYADVNSPISQNALLGATIVASGTGSPYYDPAHDTPTTLIAGLTQYHRSFTIPTDVPTGSYDVIFGIWADNNGNGQVDPGIDTMLGSFTGYGALTVQPALGGIFTTLSPQGAIDAGAQWRCDGGNWLGSGAQNFQVAVGNHAVSFKPASGWTTPADQVVTVNTNQTTQVAGVYAPAGSLQVSISPPGAINAGAQWEVDGGEFQNSGTTLSDLSAGNHTVSFNSVTGYTTPADQVVTINANQTTMAAGIYVVSPTPTPTATPNGTPTPTASPSATPAPTATSPPPSPTPTPVLPVQLGNISTRLRVGTGDNAMIGGFIITGTQPKKVIVRGMGPSLPVPGALADPVIEVHVSGMPVPIASNDNWMDDPNRQHVIDSGLAPSNNLESALWEILNPGTYTVVVRSKNDATGVGLFEVYDLDRTVDSKLANVSTRGFVGTEDNVMIGGIIILGGAQTRVLFRAIGPSLANFGIPNVLADPVLELHGPSGFVTIINDNWRDTQEAQIIGTGVPPSDNLEGAILVDLPPGAYTAIVRGKNDSVGVALVEAYQLNGTSAPTPSPSPTPNPTSTAVATPTANPSPTPNPTSTPVATPTPNPSPTPSPTSTPVATPTPTPSPTATPTPGPNLIVNGSFELPGFSGGNSGPGRQQYVAPSTDITGWIVAGTGDVFIHKCPDIQGAGSTYCLPQDGSYYLDLSGSGPPHATIYQDVPTTPGSTYQLSFYVGASDQTPPAPTISVRVTGGAILLNTSVTPLGPGANITWTLQTFAFVADSSSAHLEFSGTSSTDDNASFVDSVSFRTLGVMSVPTAAPPMASGTRSRVPISPSR